MSPSLDCLFCCYHSDIHWPWVRIYGGQECSPHQLLLHRHRRKSCRNQRVTSPHLHGRRGRVLDPGAGFSCVPNGDQLIDFDGHQLDNLMMSLHFVFLLISATCFLYAPQGCAGVLCDGEKSYKFKYTCFACVAASVNGPGVYLKRTIKRGRQNPAMTARFKVLHERCIGERALGNTSTPRQN